MKVSELEGALLDYWVAKAEGLNVHLRPVGEHPLAACVENWQRAIIVYKPSANWAQGGRIIEREYIQIMHIKVPDMWIALIEGNVCAIAQEMANTPLEAAMRCYVAFKFGDEVNDA